MHTSLPGVSSLARAAVLAAVAAVVSVPAGTESALAQEVSPEGQWDGAIQTPGSALQVVVDLVRADGGSWRGQIDIPAQGVEDRDLGRVTVRADSVRFAIPGIPGSPSFEGSVTAGGDSLTGSFSQGGRSFPFRLARTGPPEIAEGPDPAQALADFDGAVREAMEAFHVPGASVAIVKDGEVVHSRGYGVRDRSSGAAVTDSTIFPIGSMTKSFTSLLLGDLVDEGAIAWDEPVQTWLPEFRLHEDYPSNHATPVDLLSHRTGLPRHDLLWIAWEEVDTAVSRADFVRELRHLEPTAEFRTEWQYNNFMYAAAGLLAGRVTDSSWEEQVRERFLEPLGMDRTSVSVEGMTATPDRATGYRVVRPDSGEVRIEPMDYFRIDAMAPAGAINSSAAEMTRWLELHLNGGEVDGERIVPSAAVERTHRRVVPVEGGASAVAGDEVSHTAYAPGWQVQDYRGHRMLQHGGGIDGFTSLMAIYPEDDLGVVVLSNRLGGGFTTAVTLVAADRMLGLEPSAGPLRFERQPPERIEPEG